MTPEIASLSVAGLRAFLRAEFGPRRYRITRAGEVHVFGVMPNTICRGWYLYGYLPS